MHYVIGDVHGCYDEMISLVHKIEEKDKNSVIIFLGDFIDRGPRIEDTARWMMEHVTKDGKYRCVMGNHEAMALSWYYNHYRKNRYPFLPPAKYDFHRTAENLGPESLEKLVHFMEGLPLYLMLDINGTKYCIVHAWYDERRNDTDTYLWERKEDNMKFDGIIVHGHTPTLPSNHPSYTRYGLIHHGHKAVNLDGGCYLHYSHPEAPFPCMLCGLCLETGEEIYPSAIKDRFKTHEDYENYCRHCLDD